ncbi:MAG: glycosyltransferase [Calothrix sp. C42_A2020_038]|nr:glycosyltransferase [Calothrix sp. C42_A2020_038]
MHHHPHRNKDLNAEDKVMISPWVKVLVIICLLIFMATIFVTNWTSSGPTILSSNELIPAFNHDNSFDSALNPFEFKNSVPPISNKSELNRFQSKLSNSIHNTKLGHEGLLPEFLQAPSQPLEVLFPTIAVAYICLLLRFIPSNNWTRLILKIFFLALMLRYFVWRTIATLNFEHWLSTIFSLFVYSVEAISLFSFVIYSLQSIWSSAKKRSAQADLYFQDISSGKYLPSVDVFVPTYNEPEQVVCRTVIGCQAMNYPNKKVYILDDTRREHIRELAKKLGCEYITRPDNKHAKAGNINNALPQTSGELITIMDADFVPFRNFLMRTVGFFQKQDVALVQTPQTFYNPDHHARNLGIDHMIHDDLAGFFAFSQSCRDVVNSALCCGTSYVVRRTALESTGGYLTKCLAEDSPTSIKMLTLGWQIVYLGEILSSGESTRTYVDFIKQRVRWHHSNYQIFCAGDTLPIWSKLNFWQKTYFLTFYIGNFGPFFRLVFMFTPVVTMCLGVSPIISSPTEFTYYLVPYLWLLVGSLSWSTEYSSSFFWNEIYETIVCYPFIKCLIFAIRHPFGLAFKVTRKGVKAESKNYNLSHTYPLLIGIFLMVAVLCLHLVGYRVGIWQTAVSSEFGLMFFLLIYNIIVMTIAFLAGIDQPERRAMDRFPLRTACRIVMEECIYTGYTNNVSEGGANITLVGSSLIAQDTQLVTVELIDYNLSLQAKIIRTNSQKKNHNITLEFANIGIEQNRRLVEFLYCDMTWWKQAKRPSSVDVFLEMISSFLGMRSLLTKYQ